MKDQQHETKRQTDQLQSKRFTTLHLFAGAGGGILADLILGHRPICAVEIESYCQQVLQAAQNRKDLPWFPIYDDVKRFDGTIWTGLVDMVCGGFPCQPFSQAGRRKGSEDERNMWPDTLRIIREVGSNYVFLENVARLPTFDYFGQILGELGQTGYDVEWGILSAAAVGACHLRERLWMFAWKRDAVGVGNNTDCIPRRNVTENSSNEFRRQSRYDATEIAKDSGEHQAKPNQKQASIVSNAKSKSGQYDIRSSSQQSTQRTASTQGRSRSVARTITSSTRNDELSRNKGNLRDVTSVDITEIQGKTSDADCVGSQRICTDSTRGSTRKRKTDNAGTSNWWNAEPGMDRMVNGMANQVDRLRCIGNGQVPLCAAMAFLLLWNRMLEDIS